MTQLEGLVLLKGDSLSLRMQGFESLVFHSSQGIEGSVCMISKLCKR